MTDTDVAALVAETMAAGRPDNAAGNGKRYAAPATRVLGARGMGSVTEPSWMGAELGVNPGDYRR